MKRVNKHTIIYWILGILGTAVFVSLIFNRNIWMDEAYSGNMMRNSYAQMLREAAGDTLPPLYYFLVKPFTDLFGFSLPVLKIASIIPMVLTMALGAFMLRKYFNDKAAWLYMVCIAVMPQMQEYGVQIRMYSWAMFFTTACGFMAYEVCQTNSKRAWVLLTLAAAGAAYTHHFAFVACGFVYLFLLVYSVFFDRKYLKAWFFSVLAVFLLYLPWGVVFIKQFGRVNDNFWIPPITVPVAFAIARFPFISGNDFFSALLLLLTVSAGVRFLLAEKEEGDWFAFLAPCVFAGTFLFGFIFSKLFSSILCNRYLFPTLGLFWIFLAVEGGRLKKKWMYGLLFAAVCTIGVSTYIKQYRIEYVKGTEEAEAFFEENLQKEDAIISSNGAMGIVFQFLYPEVLNIYENDSNLDKNEKMVQKVEAVKGKLWYVYTPGDNQHFNSYTARGYQMNWIGSYNIDGCKFELYQMEKQGKAE